MSTDRPTGDAGQGPRSSRGIDGREILSQEDSDRDHELRVIAELERVAERRAEIEKLRRRRQALEAMIDDAPACAPSAPGSTFDAPATKKARVAGGLTEKRIRLAADKVRRQVDGIPAQAKVAELLHVSVPTLKRAMEDLKLGQWPPAPPDEGI